jgi:hypothetical protein
VGSFIWRDGGEDDEGSNCGKFSQNVCSVFMEISINSSQ